MPPHATATQMNDPSSVREWLAEKHPKQLALLDTFETELRMAGRLSKHPSQIDRLSITLRTVEVLKTMIGSTRWRSPAELLVLLRGLGRDMDAAGGFREPAIGNVVRRILAAVREEVLSGGTTRVEDRSSLESMLWALPQHVKTHSRVNSMSLRSTSQESQQSQERHKMRSESVGSIGDILEQVALDAEESLSNLPPIFFMQPRSDLKQSIMEVIQEITSDLEDLHKTINEQATNHIHSGEVILTYGKSDTVIEFLKAAAVKKLRFTVIVCECAPHYEGHDMARALAEPTEAGNSIEVCVIPDSAIFAMMARVNKVLLPAHAVLANGGLVARSGCNLVVSAAAENAVPVVCLTGMFKLTPLFPHEGQDTLNDLLSPGSVVDYASQQDQQVDFVNPLYDYIRPEHINLYVTNVGSFQPSYIYRLLSEYYHQDDWGSPN
uniref:Translation initiation factor eIF2B subunit beta n=1 Tax=Pseudo-nitzschia australis TaxID=44445 RepID=A0A7S4AXC2_9STRA|mmetsp:Transcript_19887/g.43199  ORF Transcript_19887/g.43199 Transcript_19887/m.43199 type:complete len:437 (+) Transcript_19887:239-1549(+)|eukprot:CAMPEP_0168185900 /NCGR_PEP_ID=MMETSP0139_2-20121125/14112_1 /TAXON_ID=44445 /ORGANISM="Pseudo-nitzschia australis, Strain 10249 10 AB" /LENGTH=436 /DNA_ID=CAMNT_0008107805 /DNA_START=174 /DNA_END=1484 /DNA_ORIENTATION=+